MIDVENLVYEKVYTAVKSKHPTVFMESTYVNRVSSYPCVSLVEEDNAVYPKTQDLSNRENHASVMYECNVYTDGIGRKQEAKRIANTVDQAMSNMGFTRIFRSQIPNAERAIYRITIRYKAVISTGVKDGENTIFYIYNK